MNLCAPYVCRCLWRPNSVGTEIIISVSHLMSLFRHVHWRPFPSFWWQPSHPYFLGLWMLFSLCSAITWSPGLFPASAHWLRIPVTPNSGFGVFEGCHWNQYARTGRWNTGARCKVSEKIHMLHMQLYADTRHVTTAFMEKGGSW